MNIKDPKGVLYLNCENNKALPFNSQFEEFTISDPLQVYEAFSEAENMAHIHTIIIDSVSYLMDMFESVYVVGSTNTMAQWGAYAQFFKNLMSQYVAKSTKNVIMTAHTMDVMNESEMISETLIKVKGSLMNQGIESYFSTVISSKKIPTKNLAIYGSDLLTISEEEELLGFKYVYQTKLTKNTVNERIRGPMGLFKTSETFIDNDIQNVINKLHQYYD